MFQFIKSMFSLDAYYNSIQKAFISLFGTEQMLHYPLYHRDSQSLLEGQTYLTAYCMGKLGDLDKKVMLDIGCGNGVQSLHILREYSPFNLIGIELNTLNLGLAQEAVLASERDKVVFYQDNAEVMENIKNESIDIAICIESAFHYSSKTAFLRQIKRVLKPDGTFLIADLVLKDSKKSNLWERKVKFNNWTTAQYARGFQETGLAPVLFEDLTPNIIRAFEDHKKWFINRPKTKGLTFRISLVFAKTILKLYTRQLKTRHSYVLYVGQRQAISHASGI